MGAFEEMPRVRTSTKLTRMAARAKAIQPPREYVKIIARSEEHTSELQSQSNLVCRLLLEKKKKREQTKYSRCPSVCQLSHRSTPPYLSHSSLSHGPSHSSLQHAARILRTPLRPTHNTLSC